MHQTLAVEYARVGAAGAFRSTGKWYWPNQGELGAGCHLEPWRWEECVTPKKAQEVGFGVFRELCDVGSA